MSFNTASGMRSHATTGTLHIAAYVSLFQYRKRYEVTCDSPATAIGVFIGGFQYRKRYEVTCDYQWDRKGVFYYAFQYRKRYEVTCDCKLKLLTSSIWVSFNTASGMRSHATKGSTVRIVRIAGFNTASGMRSHATRFLATPGANLRVSIPQAV